MDNFLERYNPKVSVFKQFEIPENLSEVDKAYQSWKMLVLAKRSQEGLFLLIGRILKSFREEKLYLKLDYENFTQFLSSDELGFSQEKAFMYIRTYEYFIEYLELEPDKVGQMNVSRLSRMMPVLKQIEDKEKVIEKIEEFNSLRLGQFEQEVRRQKKEPGKPTIYFQEESGKWKVNYFTNTTNLFCLGDFNEE